MVYTPSASGLTRDLRAELGETGDMRRGGGLRDPEKHLAGRPAPQRQAELRYLRADASIVTRQHAVPMHPVFDAAFSAFARGTLIATTRGPVAVEDLDPGDKVVTNERGPSPVLWIGRMTWGGQHDDAFQTQSGPRLTRIRTGALGLGRPLADVLTGPGARILHRNEGRPGEGGTGRMLRPIHDMIDGTHVISLSPPGEVELYHVGLRRHATITAAGLDFETYHPGPGFETQMTLQQLALFMQLFPHTMRPADFGSLVHPRAPLGDGGRAVA